MNRKDITKWAIGGLIVLEIIFAMVSQIETVPAWGKIAALVAVLAIFSWLLSESLEQLLEHRRNTNWRVYPTGAMMLFLFGLTAYLVHYGLGKVLLTTAEEWQLIVAGAGFCLFTLFGKACFAYDYPVEAEQQEAELTPTAEIINVFTGKES